MSEHGGRTGSHVPVLLEAVMAGLNIRPGGLYIDGTFGRGGHSLEIRKRAGPEGRLLAIDRDPRAVLAARALKNTDEFEIAKGEIADIREIAAERGMLGKVDGLLFDLGVSSPQLDDPERGFSFRSDGPLDMRMDPTTGVSAADWLATVDEKKLKQVLSRFGEERFAGRIAKAIVTARVRQPLRRTLELAAIVADAVPAGAPRREGERRRHPATKTFQAIRIQVNDELRQLEAALAAAADVLAAGGRLCVVTFHSLEDRMVKRFMRDASREPEAWRGMPSIPPDARPRFRVIGRAVTASGEEIAANARARSARLRVAERL